MNKDLQFLDASGVCELLRIGRTKWWYITRKGHRYHDPKAPQSYRCGRRGRRWRLDEVVEWAKQANPEGVQ